ncbi:PREDICTED: uncharacterized protein LOC106125568 [Papilio xuthus]|uniref:Uncharacterized protein LOC106125568 n=1 Tax=Papilio xuthus TaxID=66420 RepID=A0A194PX24_PAPXU|nr:PREDICTED: uncharacterized protein LOC106125568 [Papilio xuthus]XP_013178280.1 PREDICTED: uncharacterized protein LOC106125568 [Papilio xuthus]KPI97906.1 hypothetical protein RR46_11027 [Papilio xuthus]
MKRIQLLGLVLSILSAVLCSPFDDGKYKPKSWGEYDDGKYYRPLDEGKYIPGDEGRYTYIYKQGNWPIDGTYHYGEGEDDPYMGYRVYASRYPYVHGVIKGLINKYVSSDNLQFGEATEGSTNHYSKVYADKEVAVKCQYLMPNSNGSEFTTQYPPNMKVKKGEKLGSFYSYKGSKVLSTISNALTNKMKLEYEVFVRVVEDVSSPTTKVPTPLTKEEIKSPLIILRPSSYAKVESTTKNVVKNSISEIVKSLIVKEVLPTVAGIEPSAAEELKLAIGDVPLLPIDDVETKPTLPYEIFSNSYITSTTDNVDVLTQEAATATATDSADNLTQKDVTTTATDSEDNLTQKVGTVTARNILDILTQRVATVTETDNTNFLTQEAATITTTDNVREVEQELTNNDSNVTISELLSTTEGGER